MNCKLVHRDVKFKDPSGATIEIGTPVVVNSKRVGANAELLLLRTEETVAAPKRRLDLGAPLSSVPQTTKRNKTS